MSDIARWKKYLRYDPTRWLLETNDPSILLWYQIDIAHRPEDAPGVLATRERVLYSEPVQKIFAAQDEMGFWDDAEHLAAPHYTATVWNLALLAELGIPRTSRRARNACEFVLRNFLNEDETFERVNAIECGYLLRALGYFNYANDARAVRAARKLRGRAVTFEESLCALWGWRSFCADGKMAEAAHENIERVLENAAANSRGNAAANSRENAAANSRGNATANSRENAAANSRGNATANSRENAAADSRGNAAANSMGNAAANSMGNAAATSRGNAAADSRGNAAANSMGNAAANSRGNAAADSRGNAAADSRGNAAADSRGNAAANSMGNAAASVPYTFPQFDARDELFLLRVLSEYERVDDARVASLIDALISKQNERAQWTLERDLNVQLVTPLERAGEPSRWITLNALRVIVKLVGAE